MLRRILFCLKYYFFLLTFFVLQKPVFLLFHARNFAPEISSKDFWQVVWHGLPLDFSMSAYLSIIPFLLVCVSVFRNYGMLRHLLHFYTIIIFLITTILFSVDLDLYTAWNFRIDATVLIYLDSPKEVAANFDCWLVVRQIAIMLATFVLLLWTGRKWFWNDFAQFETVTKKAYALVPLCLTIALFYPIRGGFSDATMNVGWVYYSENTFLNHAAINPSWNFFNSLAHGNDTFDDKYRYFDENELAAAVEPMLPKQDSAFVQVLNTTRPNIILVIMESFSANAIEPLGGEQDVTPNLNRLSEEGILFTDFYGNSFRTDRGVMSIMSAYPVPPKYSVMKNPNKTANIPNIGETLKNAGYDIAFYYGGDENFTNMRSYLINGGFERIISDKDFSQNEKPTSWGAADHFVFRRLLDDLKRETHEQPFFRTLLTLSSHEPFDVPMPTKFEGDSRNEKYKNSVYYTDSAIGEFVENAKKEPWWDNTLMIFVSDHSFPFPEGIENHIARRYQVPCLWIGGAIITPQQCHRPASQIDLCATLLAQLNLPHNEFIFSKNIFDSSQHAFGFYSYHHGFGVKTADKFCAYDLDSEKIIDNGDNSLAQQGKAFMQYIYNDIDKR